MSLLYPICLNIISLSYVFFFQKSVKNKWYISLHTIICNVSKFWDDIFFGKVVHFHLEVHYRHSSFINKLHK